MNLNSKPEFCFISPTAYLHRLKDSTTHLTLAHLVDNDEEYAAYYATCAKMGDYIIMDNSAYELLSPYNTEHLVRLGHKCGASAIILPDYPFAHSSVTVAAANKYIHDFKSDGFHTFFVPQSERGDLVDWNVAYDWAANHEHIDIIGMSILGIPNALPNIDPAYARVVMSELLINGGSFNKDKHHHFLGLNSGPKLEIPSLLRMGVLDTIDSSGPVWAAIMGHKYSNDCDSFQSVSKLKLPVDFSIAKTKDRTTLHRIDHNIQLTRELFESDAVCSDETWYAQE